MSEQRKSFVFYNSFLEIVDLMPTKEEKNEMLWAIIQMGLTDEIPNDIPLYMKTPLVQMRASVRGAKDRHNIAVKNGRKGGKSGSGDAKRRYGNKNAAQKTQANASKRNLNDNVNVNVNTIDNLHCQLGDRQKRFKRFADPICVEEIKAEDIQRGHYEMRDGERYWVVDEQ